MGANLFTTGTAGLSGTTTTSQDLQPRYALIWASTTQHMLRVWAIMVALSYHRPTPKSTFNVCNNVPNDCIQRPSAAAHLNRDSKNLKMTLCKICVMSKAWRSGVFFSPKIHPNLALQASLKLNIGKQPSVAKIIAKHWHKCPNTNEIATKSENNKKIHSVSDTE